MENQENEVIVRDVGPDSVIEYIPTSAMVEVEKAEVAQRTQAMFVIAKKFPRNEQAAIVRIRQAVQRYSLAEIALYSFPRAGKTVTGPSIRLAEVLAQSWGNMDFGVRELEQVETATGGRSTLESYCSDLETNTHQTRTFMVFHKRRVGKGKNFKVESLDDPRDIYEHVANHGARRMRACITSIIPRDVVDMAVDQVRATLRKGNGELLIDRVNKMSLVFAQQGVSVEMLEKKLGHELKLTTEDEIVELQGIFNALKNGESKRQDWFKMGSDPVGGKAAELNDKMVSKP